MLAPLPYHAGVICHGVGGERRGAPSDPVGAGRRRSVEALLRVLRGRRLRRRCRLKRPTWRRSWSGTRPLRLGSPVSPSSHCPPRHSRRMLAGASRRGMNVQQLRRRTQCPSPRSCLHPGDQTCFANSCSAPPAPRSALAPRPPTSRSKPGKRRSAPLQSGAARPPRLRGGRHHRAARAHSRRRDRRQADAQAGLEDRHRHRQVLQDLQLFSRRQAQRRA